MIGGVHTQQGCRSRRRCTAPVIVAQFFHVQSPSFPLSPFGMRRVSFECGEGPAPPRAQSARFSTLEWRASSLLAGALFVPPNCGRTPPDVGDDAGCSCATLSDRHSLVKRSRAATREGNAAHWVARCLCSVSQARGRECFVLPAPFFFRTFGQRLARMPSASAAKLGGFLQRAQCGTLRQTQTRARVASRHPCCHGELRSSAGVCDSHIGAGLHDGELEPLKELRPGGLRLWGRSSVSLCDP